MGGDMINSSNKSKISSTNKKTMVASMCENWRIFKRGKFVVNGLEKALAAFSIAAISTSSFAQLPTNPNIQNGNINITNPSANQLNVNQTSNTGIINWDTFNIGAGNGVQFNNGSGSTLNRVVSTGSPTEIYGNLSATGSVYLINQNGITIGNTGQITTGGSFIASTMQITDADYLDGGDNNYIHSPSSGKISVGQTSVQNNGNIVSSAGDVFLIGRTATNNGTINAQSGTVGLAGGSDVIIRDASSNERIFISAGQVANNTGAVTNTGTINAGVRAELVAYNNNPYALAINNTGTIRVTPDGNVVGSPDYGIRLETAAAGNINVSGTLDAQEANGIKSNINIKSNNLQGKIDVDNANISGTGDITINSFGDVNVTNSNINGGANTYANKVEINPAGAPLVGKVSFIGNNTIKANNVTITSGVDSGGNRSSINQNNVVISNSTNGTNSGNITIYGFDEVNTNAIQTENAQTGQAVGGIVASTVDIKANSIIVPSDIKADDLYLSSSKYGTSGSIDVASGTNFTISDELELYSNANQSGQYSDLNINLYSPSALSQLSIDGFNDITLNFGSNGLNVNTFDYATLSAQGNVLLNGDITMQSGSLAILADNINNTNGTIISPQLLLFLTGNGNSNIFTDTDMVFAGGDEGSLVINNTGSISYGQALVPSQVGTSNQSVTINATGNVVLLDNLTLNDFIFDASGAATVNDFNSTGNFTVNADSDGDGVGSIYSISLDGTPFVGDYKINANSVTLNSGYTYDSNDVVLNNGIAPTNVANGQGAVVNISGGGNNSYGQSLGITANQASVTGFAVQNVSGTGVNVSGNLAFVSDGNLNLTGNFTGAQGSTLTLGAGNQVIHDGGAINYTNLAILTGNRAVLGTGGSIVNVDNLYFNFLQQNQAYVTNSIFSPLVSATNAIGGQHNIALISFTDADSFNIVNNSSAAFADAQQTYVLGANGLTNTGSQVSNSGTSQVYETTAAATLSSANGDINIISEVSANNSNANNFSLQATKGDINFGNNTNSGSINLQTGSSANIETYAQNIYQGSATNQAIIEGANFGNSNLNLLTVGGATGTSQVGTSTNVFTFDTDTVRIDAGDVIAEDIDDLVIIFNSSVNSLDLVTGGNLSFNRSNYGSNLSKSLTVYDSLNVTSVGNIDIFGDIILVNNGGASDINLTSYGNISLIRGDIVLNESANVVLDAAGNVTFGNHQNTGLSGQIINNNGTSNVDITARGNIIQNQPNGTLAVQDNGGSTNLYMTSGTLLGGGSIGGTNNTALNVDVSTVGFVADNVNVNDIDDVTVGGGSTAIDAVITAGGSLTFLNEIGTHASNFALGILNTLTANANNDITFGNGGAGDTGLVAAGNALPNYQSPQVEMNFTAGNDIVFNGGSIGNFTSNTQINIEAGNDVYQQNAAVHGGNATSIYEDPNNQSVTTNLSVVASGDISGTNGTLNVDVDQVTFNANNSNISDSDEITVVDSTVAGNATVNAASDINLGNGGAFAAVTSTGANGSVNIDSANGDVYINNNVVADAQTGSINIEAGDSLALTTNSSSSIISTGGVLSANEVSLSANEGIRADVNAQTISAADTNGLTQNDVVVNLDGSGYAYTVVQQFINSNNGNSELNVLNSAVTYLGDPNGNYQNTNNISNAQFFIGGGNALANFSGDFVNIGNMNLASNSSLVVAAQNIYFGQDLANGDVRGELKVRSGSTATFIAQNNFSMLNNSAIFGGSATESLVIVVDNANPTSFGPGSFIMEQGTSIGDIGNGLDNVAIYTSMQGQNSIEGTINGVNFAPGAEFQNSDQEQWGTFYNPNGTLGGGNLNSANPSLTVFYKDGTAAPTPPGGGNPPAGGNPGIATGIANIEADCENNKAAAGCEDIGDKLANVKDMKVRYAKVEGAAAEDSVVGGNSSEVLTSEFKKDINAKDYVTGIEATSDRLAAVAAMPLDVVQAITGGVFGAVTNVGAGTVKAVGDVVGGAANIVGSGVGAVGTGVGDVVGGVAKGVGAVGGGLLNAVGIEATPSTVKAPASQDLPKTPINNN
jgi:hypothetical protein